jgi:hypothetical protein
VASISNRLGYPISVEVDAYRLTADGPEYRMDEIFSADTEVPSALVVREYVRPETGTTLIMVCIIFQLLHNYGMEQHCRSTKAEELAVQSGVPASPRLAYAPPTPAPSSASS